VALNYNAIQALTRRKHIPKLRDNFFRSHPLLAYFRQRAREPFDGHTVLEPLIYSELSGVGSYKGYDAMTYDESIPITAAEYDLRHLAATVIIAKTEELENEGSDVRVLNLVRSKVTIAEEGLKKKWATMLYGDGTGNTNKDFLGLGIVVADTGTLGGINRGATVGVDGYDGSFWKAKVYANGGTARPLTTRLMRTVVLAVSDGPDKPDLIITTDPLWNRLAEISEGKLVINSQNGKMLADLGFQVLEFMGIPVVSDKDCTANSMFFLNTKYLKFRIHPGADFVPTPWRQADNKIARKQEILVSGNLTCSNCRRQGVLQDLDEAGYS